MLRRWIEGVGWCKEGCGEVGDKRVRGGDGEGVLDAYLDVNSL
jgi:hypothetical protein